MAQKPEKERKKEKKRNFKVVHMSTKSMEVGEWWEMDTWYALRNAT